MPVSNPKDTDARLDELLVEQSSQLLEALQHGGEGEKRALADWLTQSPRHTRTHLFMSALEEELRHLDPERKIPIPDVRADGAAIREFPRLRAGVSRSGRRWLWGAAAAVVLSVTAGTVYRPT